MNIFPEIEFDFDHDIHINVDSLAFDYEEFKKNGAYLADWQERNKEQLKKIKEEIKETRREALEEQEELREEMRELHKELRVQARIQAEEARIQAEAIRKNAEKERRMAREELIQIKRIENQHKRDQEIQKIIEKATKAEGKENLKIKGAEKCQTRDGCRLLQDYHHQLISAFFGQ